MSQSDAPAGAEAGEGVDPALEPYRELTIASVVLGVMIGSVMTAAFVYIALKLGFGLGGSTVAAILGFAVLRGVLRKGSIVENNINQTVASGVNNASSGVAFTLPALFILGEDFTALSAILSALAGSFLGIVVIIPLRKQMIEFERLRFPSGVAVATLLKSPGAGARQAKLLLAGFGIATAVHIVANLVHIEELNIGAAIGIPAWFPVAIGISFASLGAGMLSGRGGLPFVAGGVLAWWVICPVVFAMGWVPTAESMDVTAHGGVEEWRVMGVAYLQMLRPLGIGILIGGALSGVVASFPALKSAIQSIARAAKASAVTGVDSDEMSANVLVGGVALSFLVLFGAALLSSPDVGIGQAILIATVGTVWLGLAGLIVAQATGMTDISPISGMSLIGVTLMFFLSGGNVVAAVILGVAVSIGIGQCADMMSDLKSGHLIGATPRRQQLAQFSVAWIGVPIAVGVLYLLWGDGGGFGPGNDSLSAPQGAALAGILDSLRAGAAPLDKYLSGAAIGLGLGIYPLSGLGVLIGLAMYLPFYITVTYGVGCLIAIALQRKYGGQWMGSTVVPVAAGFIIGEALTNLSVVLIQLALS